MTTRCVPSSYLVFGVLDGTALATMLSPCNGENGPAGTEPAGRMVYSCPISYILTFRLSLPLKDLQYRSRKFTVYYEYHEDIVL